VRVGRHRESGRQRLKSWSGFTLTPFTPRRSHTGSPSTRKKLHSFSYSSRSSILRVMNFLWEHKTKANTWLASHTHAVHVRPGAVVLEMAGWGEAAAHPPWGIWARAGAFPSPSWGWTLVGCGKAEFRGHGKCPRSCPLP